eukprot:CAMPEP_0203773230 /NCGR_PEP_ID=MMETSP0099_2-20121227/4534_1 /ASSEMBLY_ACC=CAM_ASM_000209 /TAXON_ID=96639 /ORGANISM=" , Strain NY0313808BC1" /LENGTH=261 /DNA_ID=CAMNT_0050671021 /DNA_START=133 /DNA_END=915 /DNA_ORIENTATION=-
MPGNGGIGGAMRVKERHVSKANLDKLRRNSERFYNPEWPSWAEMYLNEIQIMFFVVFSVLVVYDAVHNGLMMSNGRFISLVDTVGSVYSFRARLPKREESGLGRFAWILFVCFVLKFQAGTAVSVILGTTPVLFKGSRHLISFLFGFMLVWFSPGDVVYENLRSSLSVKLMVSICGGLYKFRKALFAVESCRGGYGGFPLAVTVVLLALDGNTVARNFFLWWENHQAALTLTTFRVSCWSGLRKLVVELVVPDLSVTAFIW